MLEESISRTILSFQKKEITEYFAYRRLSEKAKGANAEVLKTISEDELRHYNEWKEYTQTEVRPSKIALLKFLVVSKVLGLTFAMTMMEGGEEKAGKVYPDIIDAVPRAREIIQDETGYEKLLVGMIDEEKIRYVGSMILGVNDALVELTGALAGLTFTLQNARLIGAAGLVTGIAASLSMSASEYLSQKSEKESKNPFRAAFYTGIVYMSTVLLLVSPFLMVGNYYVGLGVTVLVAISVVLFFSFFVSVVKELSFRRMFLEMLLISLGVAAVSFIIGWAANQALHVEI